MQNLLRQAEFARRSRTTNLSFPPMGAARRSPASDDLPPPDTKRWVIHRKAAVVAAVHNGKISRDEVCRIYNISAEEFLNWERLLGVHGPAGLRVTRTQQYRDPKPES